jgi:hypothetical protein
LPLFIFLRSLFESSHYNFSIQVINDRLKEQTWHWFYQNPLKEHFVPNIIILATLIFLWILNRIYLLRLLNSIIRKYNLPLKALNEYLFFIPFGSTKFRIVSFHHIREYYSINSKIKSIVATYILSFYNRIAIFRVLSGYLFIRFGYLVLMHSELEGYEFNDKPFSAIIWYIIGNINILFIIWVLIILKRVNKGIK